MMMEKLRTILLVTSRTGLNKEEMNVHGWAQKFIRYNEYT